MLFPICAIEKNIFAAAIKAVLASGSMMFSRRSGIAGNGKHERKD